ncbi:MAG: hypothetical protein ABEI77_02015 [Halorientalis sp.]
MATPSVYDHLRPTGDEIPDGIYRVVGTSDETVTLLRVGDHDERRVSTGEVVTVDRGDLDSFESAANPDGNRPVGAVVAAVSQQIYWSFRAFGQQLARHPLATAIAVALFGLGTVGASYLPIPAVVAVLLTAIGGGLSLVGSGRL